MKIDEIIRNPFYIVAGILLALISLILVGFVLAIGDSYIYQHEIYDDFMGYPLQTGLDNPVLESVEDDLAEFVAQDGSVCMETEQGTFEIYDFCLPDVLPLCLTQEVLDNWWVVLKVSGGYEPIDGFAILCQKGEYKGTIDINYEYAGHEPCYYDYWVAHFALTDGPIELKKRYGSHTVPCGKGVLKKNNALG
ncbi:MAG: hypothetical protein ACFE96_06715 [Candidatus Hermodarchaeota archaeon]